MHVRSDVDAALGKQDMRSGFIFRVDWFNQPAGNQTYRVLGRTGCEWSEKTFTVNVNPAPPPPAASLSINDQSRTVGTTSTSTGIGTSVVCTSYYPGGGCASYSSQTTGTYCLQYSGSTCIQYSSTGTGQCIQYSGSTCIQYANTGYNTGYYGTTTNEYNMDFTVTLSPATTQQVQVDYATADGSAVNGTDYQATSGTLTFAPNETSKTITVRVYNRGNMSGNRDFRVNLSNARNASISDGTGTGTIRSSGYYGTTGCSSYDVNGNCISYGGSSGICPVGQYWNGFSCTYSGVGTGTGLQVFDTSCNEGSACVFSVTSPTYTTMTYTTSNGTALGASPCGAGGSADYTTASSTLSFSGSTTISIQTCADTFSEGAETFSVTVSSSNVTVTRPTATGTINANAT
jgi:hypothetical protein